MSKRQVLVTEDMLKRVILEGYNDAVNKFLEISGE